MNARSSPHRLDPVNRPLEERHVQPCFGVGCLARGGCSCYHAVEHYSGTVTTRGTCLRDGGYPSFEPAAREVVRHRG